jgi:hypothetical protein
MKNVLLILGSLLIIYSCKKDEIQKDPPIGASDYLPMNIGNYWVYQQYEIEDSFQDIPSPIYDSIIITKDTLIHNTNYYKFDHYQCYLINNSIQTHNEGPLYYRDSLKYLVSSKGQIFFSENNFSDTLLTKVELNKKDTIYRITYKAERSESRLTVPAGSYYELINFKGTVNCNPKYSKTKNSRFTDTYYAAGVGEIFRSAIFLQGTNKLEKKLLRYKLNK